MAKLIELSRTNVTSVTNIQMEAEAVVNNVVTPTTPTDFVDADTGSTTAVDGIIIPLVDRGFLDELASDTQIGITDAEEIPGVKVSEPRRFRLTLDADNPLPIKDRISIGSFPSTHLGRFDIVKLDPDNLNIIDVKEAFGTSATLEAADLVGEEIYSTVRWAGCAVFGTIDISLGAGWAGVYKIALIYTDDPGSGAAFDTRLAANEVIWYDTLSGGADHTVNFNPAGFEVTENGFVPPEEALAPATGGEKRLMLAIYLDQGAGTTAGADLSATITTTNKTLIETTVL